MPLAARAPNNLPPAVVVTDFSGSSLMAMVISPELTSFDLAARISTTSASTMTVNITTPKIISCIESSCYSEMPEKDMKPNAIRPAVMKVMPSPRRAGGTSEYFIFSRMAAISTMASAQLMPEPRP